MGPPAAVPLRDVSCVMILLHLSLLLSLSPSGSNFWQDFKTCWRLGENMEHYISKQNKKCVCVRTRMHCGALQGAAGSGQVHFLAPPGCLTSGVRSARPLHHLCSMMSIPPCWQPNQGERRVAEPSWCWPYPSPTAETPGCYPTLLLNFSPPQTQLISNKRGGGGDYSSSQTYWRRWFSLCLPSL